MTFEEIADNFMWFILDPDFYGWLGVLRFIFLCISLVLFVAVIILISKSSWLGITYATNAKEFSQYRLSEDRKFLRKWRQIKNRLETKKEAEWKLAVIEADNLLKDVLNKMGYSGDTSSEKLAKADPSLIPSKEELQSVKGVVDSVVHDPSFRIQKDQSEKIIKIYESVFEKLDMF